MAKHRTRFGPGAESRGKRRPARARGRLKANILFVWTCGFAERNAVMIKAKNGRDVIPSLRDSRERAACPRSHHQARPRGATTGEIGSITSSQRRPIVAVSRFAPNVSTLCHSPAELHHSPVCRQSLHQRMLNPAGRERSCPGITPPERIRAGVNRPALPFTLTGV